MLTKEEIEKTLDERIRPSLRMDGGNIDLVKVEDDNVYVKLVGACGSCPGAQMTLKMGVERILKEEYPDLKQVIPV